MKSGSRAVAAWLTLTGLAFAAVFAILALRYSAPPPRWDLVGCFAAAAAGVTGCLVTIRRGRFTDLEQAGSAAWWPDLRMLGKGWVWAVWFLAVFSYVAAVLSFSPGAEKIVGEGEKIQQVEVSRVLSTERKGRDQVSRYYSVTVRAAVPYPDGRKTVEGSFDSEDPVRAGDRIWVLYAPTAPQAGRFFDDERDELQQKVGGPATGVWPYLLPALFLTLLAGALARSRPGLPGYMKSALKEGKVRRLPVAVTEGTATLEDSPSWTDYNSSQAKNEQPEQRPAPCLRLAGPAGELITVTVDDTIDPIGAARAMADLDGRSAPVLYWAEPDEDGPRGVLVTGSRYVRCRKVSWAQDAGPAAGESAASLDADAAKPREIRRYPVWSADLHTAGFACSLFSLALMALIALGVGAVASWILGAAAFLAPVIGRQLATGKREEALKRLVADAPHQGRGASGDPARQEGGRRSG